MVGSTGWQPRDDHFARLALNRIQQLIAAIDGDSLACAFERHDPFQRQLMTGLREVEHIQFTRVMPGCIQTPARNPRATGAAHASPPTHNSRGKGPRLALPPLTIEADEPRGFRSLPGLAALACVV